MARYFRRTMTEVKICGLSDTDMIDCALDAGADHIGFVHFEKSPRHLDFDQIAALSAHVANRAQTWIVLASPSDEIVQAACDIETISGLQIHGVMPDDVERKCAKHDKILMQAFAVETENDLAQAGNSIAGRYLFDAKPQPDAELPGGNGMAFSWPIMQSLNTDKPWLLAGGLTQDTVGLAIEQSGAPGVDVSSGIERAPGVKDAQLIRSFIKAAKRAV